MSQAGRRRRFIPILVAMVLGIGLGLIALIASERQGPVAPGGPVAMVGPVTTRGVALIGGPFALTDQHGKTRTDRDFLGRYLLVFFGYTHCPDICPTGLQDMSEALDALGADAGKVQPIFVTIDPKRDTPARLKDYAANFHPKLIALSGTPAAISKTAKAYRVYYAKAPHQPGGAYLMNHSTHIYLMGPDGKYLTRFAYNTAPKEMAAKIRTQLKAGSAQR